MAEDYVTKTFIAVIPAFSFSSETKKNEDEVLLPVASDLRIHSNKNLFFGGLLGDLQPDFFCMYPSKHWCKPEISRDMQYFLLKKNIKPVVVCCEFRLNRKCEKEVILDTRKSLRFIKERLRKYNPSLKEILGKNPVEIVSKNPKKYLKQFLDVFEHPMVIIPIFFPADQCEITGEKLVVIIRDYEYLKKIISDVKVEGEFAYGNSVNFPDENWIGWKFSSSNLW